ncbi:T9SS type A sorting domain-containing protein [Mucilaginibacter terrae]|uniref:T9SS type A sorting domain-containing protein n=1 Tax=Mucilaginibacter terrae TaxID=1955052 RepID=UPI00363E9260
MKTIKLVSILGVFLLTSLTASAQFILDNLSAIPSAAFSIRKLKSTATLSLKVRRSSDNTTKDIGFNSKGDLDLGGLITFVGSSGNGYVVTWYDQSGNGRDATNTTATGQPRIVNAGIIDMQDNKPAIIWSNSPLTTLTPATPFISTAAHTISIVNKLSRTSGFHVFVGNVSTNYLGYTSPTVFNLDVGGTTSAQAYTTTQTTISNILTNTRNGASGEVWKNGSLLTKNTGTLVGTAASMTGLGGFSTFGVSGSTPEIIIFQSEISPADRLSLEANQSAYFTIAVSGQPVLNKMTSAASAAYSLRRVKNNANLAVKVRRSNDNATQDIGFNTEGSLNTTALTTFVGSASAYITTWYDQSGNGRNAVNTTTSGQPRIVNSGVIETQNGKPTIIWSNSPITTLTAPTAFISTSKHTISVVNKLSRTTGAHIFVGNTNTNQFGYSHTDTLILNSARSTNQQAYQTVQNTNTNIITNTESGPVGSTWKNGSLLVKNYGTLTGTVGNFSSLGGFSTYGVSGSMPEVLIFDTEISATDRQIMEADQLGFYGIPLTNLAAPTYINAISLPASVLLQWTAVKGATDYIIQYKASSASTWSTFADGVSTKLGVKVTGLTNGTAYDFRISTVDASSGIGPVSTLRTATPSAGSVANYNQHILISGQSLSLGWNGTPALTLTQPYSNKMLNLEATALLPLVEPATNARPNAESMSSALANKLSNLSSTSNSIVSLNGIGGTEYNLLKKGTTAYQNGIGYIAAGMELSVQINKPYRVSATATVHGERDEQINTTASQYRTFLEDWQQDYQNDMTAITGQSETIPLFLCQESSWNVFRTFPRVALGQYAAAKNNPGKIYLVAPKYMLDYSDNLHLTNYSYRRLGEYYGKVIKKVLVDNQAWLPLSPKSVNISGNIITVQFNVPVGPLVFDTTAVMSTANYGFEYRDDSNSASLTGKSGISIIAPDKVRLTLTNAPTGNNPKLRYAFSAVLGSLTGRNIAGSPKGNLRDSDPTTALYQDANVPATMGNILRNWCITFEEPVVTTLAGLVPQEDFKSSNVETTDPELTQSGGFKFYPNPVDRLLMVTAKAPFSYQILDHQGKILLHGSSDKISTVQVDVSWIPSGNYFLHVKTANSVNRKQIIVSH